jgi:hypothetical protein
MIKSVPGEKTSIVIERIFLHCLMWAFGSALSADKQMEFKKLFNVFFRGLAKVIKFPELGLIFDYFIDPLTGDTIPWQNKIYFHALLCFGIFSIFTLINC